MAGLTDRRTRRPCTWVRALATFILVLGLGMALTPAQAQAQAGALDVSTFTLDNGMRVVVAPNHRAPVATQMVWYRVGAMDEPIGMSGIAHLLEHMMFKGTSAHETGEFARIVARNGGKQNAFTSSDYTAYFETVASDRLELMMQLEADRMTNLQIKDAEVLSERDVVLEERRMRIDSDPAAQLDVESDAILYLNHPYRRPIIGWTHEVASLTPDELRAFYRHWYRPNNAILVVVGDVEPEAVRAMAERTYGTIPAGDVGERVDVTEPSPIAPRQLALQDARVKQAMWGRSYLAPSVNAGDRQEAYALDLFVQALGGGTTSRLYNRLVMEDGLAVDAGAYYDPMRRGPGQVNLYVIPREGVSLDRIEAAVDAEIARVVSEGLTAAEIERARERMLAQVIYARDSISQTARLLGSTLAIGLTIDDVEAWPDRIRGLSVDAVNAAGRATLQPAASVTAQLLPSPPAAAAVSQ